MAVIFAKTYVIPVVTGHRATCKGEQYTVSTPDYLDIVTVNSDNITCTCHHSNCDHIHAVKREISRSEKQAAQRADYNAIFDLSYGDVA